MNVADEKIAEKLKMNKKQEKMDKKPEKSIFKKIVYNTRGIITITLIILNTLFWVIPLFIFAFFKFIIPITIWRKFCSFIVDGSATAWIGTNGLIVKMMMSVKWDIQGLDGLDRNEWYMVISNHQSWTDIVVLQKIFNRKIPFLKFFLKKELIKVPVLGLAWWALDFPFMKRFSKEYLKKNPHMKGKDIEETRKACEKFKYIPVSVMNFTEGTRFSPKKHDKQNSPFKHLLKPKAGGVGYVMSIMGDYIKYILDITIVYPNGRLTMWEFVCGDLDEVIVKIDMVPVTEEIKGDYIEDKAFQDRFKLWLNDFWVEKDQKIEKILSESK